MAPPEASRWFRTPDLVWLALFALMAFAGPQREPEFILLLFAFAVLQVLEQKIAVFAPPRGAYLANLLKLALAWVIIGQSYGIQSSYYWILLVPVISAATTMGIVGTAVFTTLACALYLSFLGYIDWNRHYLENTEKFELSLRLVFLAVIGYLTQRLAEAQRTAAHEAQDVAGQLADANRNLQEAEAAMRRSERLAALGHLSAGLAHELRNPLGTIRVSAEMLLKNVQAESDIAKELAGFIASEVDRTNSLVTRFLEFARPLELQPQTADLTEALDHAIAQLERNTPRYNVTVYRNFSPDVRPFAFDAELLERVFYNLVLNAAQATPPGGEITVKTKPVGDGVEVSIIDRGAGIEPQHLENIFNPFFTTKKEGLGMGLSIVSKIVDLHGGKITVDSEPGKGSIFRVFLPVENA